MADTRPTVWVSQPLIEAAIAPLRDRVQLRSTDTVTAWSPDQIAAQLASADGAIITLNERIGAAQVAAATQLQVIANVGVGYNNLD
ncbi:D-glycerate dehydrogenase, partial [Stenotrophomonas maltophilia]|nr:D-glycerate dehydrogenase [Stenotrophomonas maltophilia]